VNKEQFIATINEYRSLIYKVCHSYCPNKADHQDLEQDIIMQLWTSMSRYNGSVKMSTWIYRIALNTAISYYRKEKNRSHVDSHSFIELARHTYDAETDEHIKLLYTFIDQLNYLDKALMLLYLDDNKYKDIADILGISESNVSTKMNRIKIKLKNFFHPEKA